MSTSPVTLTTTVDASSFQAAVAELSRHLIGVGRAARRSEYAMVRLGQVLPNPRQVRIERRARRRRLTRMLREEQRDRRWDRDVERIAQADYDEWVRIPDDARAYFGGPIVTGGDDGPVVMGSGWVDIGYTTDGGLSWA